MGFYPRTVIDFRWWILDTAIQVLQVEGPTDVGFASFSSRIICDWWRLRGSVENKPLPTGEELAHLWFQSCRVWNDIHVYPDGFKFGPAETLSQETSRVKD